MRAGVSIVICTYNGADRLPQTLRHIAGQRVTQGVNWELILVDNASKDNSAQIAQELWDLYGGTAPFTIVHQPIAGLSFAREMGFITAQYDCIIMCDDDNWLKEDYVDVAFEVMQRNPRCAMLGGNGTFVYEGEAPVWLASYSIYAGGPQAAASGKVPNHKLYGAGTILRKSAYYGIYEAGFRSLLADRMAAQLTSGGDHELCYGLALAGYEIRYDERLQFKHYITSDRLTWPYYRRYIRESASCFEVLEPYKILLETKKTSWTAFYKRLGRSFLFHLRRWVPLVWHYQFVDKKSEKGKLVRIQIIILQTRLISYFSSFSALSKNFTHVVALKKKLKAGVELPQETY